MENGQGQIAAISLLSTFFHVMVFAIRHILILITKFRKTDFGPKWNISHRFLTDSVPG